MNSKYNILIFTGMNPLENNGNLSRDIFRCLTLQGHNVRIFTKYVSDKGFPEVISVYGKLTAIYMKVLNALRRSVFHSRVAIDKDYYMFGLYEKYNYVNTGRIIRRMPFKPDFILYLYPHFFLSSRNLYELNRRTGAPILVMPVDMADFTGGCHYGNECTGYKDKCMMCPGILSARKKNYANRILDYKNNYIRKTAVFPCVNTWLQNCMQGSLLYKDKRSYKLSFLVNDSLFKPVDKIEDGKVELGIDPSKKVIFFGSVQIQEKRKGAAQLIEAMQIMKKTLSKQEAENLCIVLVGRNAQALSSLFPFESKCFDYMPVAELPKIFQGTDIFVSPSIYDAGPLMITQALMCGVPVVAFEIGQAIDVVVNGITGYKVPVSDVQGLAKSIIKLLRSNKETLCRIRENCVCTGKSHSSYDAFATRMDEIFSHINKMK